MKPPNSSAYYANMMISQLVEQSTRPWYRDRPKQTRYRRAVRRLRALARRPFELLRDALISQLGCGCDPY